MSNLVPFNQTLRCPTWREDDILPYDGWAISSPGAIRRKTRFYAFFQVSKENSTRMGKISSLPSSISRISTSLLMTLKAA